MRGPSETGATIFDLSFVDAIVTALSDRGAITTLDTMTEPGVFSPSSRLTKPDQGRLISFFGNDRDARASSVEIEIAALFESKNYPCAAALASHRKDDYVVGFYDGFGNGASWRELRRDLTYFIDRQSHTYTDYFSFWAIFEKPRPGCPVSAEEKFEADLWRELSYLTSLERREQDWGARDPDPEAKGFTFSLDGHGFFVVGLHPLSSRTSRRFSHYALVFNMTSQFQNLQRQGRYQTMVDVNRRRDLAYQGDVNPMCEEHGETWESIQFSGRKNPANWKCPFHFMSESAKP